MSSVNDSNSQPKINIFNLSIRCMSELPKVKKEVAEKYFNEAEQVAKKNTRWSRGRIGREIAKLAYEEFERTMKGKYSTPDYDFFLNCSIRAQYPYFHTDLATRVEKVLEELNLSEE